MRKAGFASRFRGNTPISELLAQAFGGKWALRFGQKPEQFGQFVPIGAEAAPDFSHSFGDTRIDKASYPFGKSAFSVSWLSFAYDCIKENP